MSKMECDYMSEDKAKYSTNWGGARKGAGRTPLDGKKTTINYYLSDTDKEVMDTVFAALRDKINLEMYDRQNLLQDGLGNIKKWIENQKVQDEYMFTVLTARKGKGNSNVKSEKERL